MIALIDIKKAIGKKLTTKFVGYGLPNEEVEEGLKRPSFFINIMPLTTENFLMYQERLINVDIMYFSENETIEENLNMTDVLGNLFKTLTVKDRVFTVQNLNFKTVDGILHCIFTLDYSDSEDDPTIYLIDEKLGYAKENISIMQELILESEVK